uniref:Uncharacterized protein n=1 Tax=Arundo donax TaxID=35708 RepID=A0A0A9EQR9_ARUDO
MQQRAKIILLLQGQPASQIGSWPGMLLRQ